MIIILMKIVNIVGYNFRLTEIHAAIAYVQTKKKDKINKIRNDIYLKSKIEQNFSNYLKPKNHSSQFTSLIRQPLNGIMYSGVSRNVIAKALLAEGILCSKDITGLACDHPVFKRKIALENNYPWFDKEFNYNEINNKK